MTALQTQLDVRRYGPDDTAAVAAVADLVTAAREVDSPRAHPVTAAFWEGRLRHGWDGETPLTYLATLPGTDEVVVAGELEVGEWDNRHLAWIDVQVHPTHRRRGYGTAMLHHLEAEARRLGRTTLGVGGWEGAPVGEFALRHGYAPSYVEAVRRQRLTAVDLTDLEVRYVAAQAAAADYELLRMPGRTPAAMLPQLATMVAAINDAPTDDLDMEDEQYPPERVAAYEEAQEARGHRLYRVVARHRETGDLAGHTVVVVETARPGLGAQHDTSVVRAHRGHRLGYLLKAEMVRWLREVEPDLVEVDTGNAASNDHMVAINEELGYELIGRQLCFQRKLAEG
ncbi:GNAT family N-acetyltransferase [Nocardioides massiliensis]|uniref:GNAT superfamily N-acetyltransferase n=1 Tax=Nocardioides massiliensis TaxID=1325935 RepID=A0ABT9NRW1_9ACTN|nr:GNAT family N-acetyltransferase [Nocardioides massiliensis]MDP9823166.1 GNAT superfamily N-acetyltransferase [Nocardioides massiliensis]